MHRLLNSYMKRIENILWHIEVNRNVLGDKKTLDDVQKSLRLLINDYKETMQNK
jgi:hypothetical protein